MKSERPWMMEVPIGRRFTLSEQQLICICLEMPANHNQSHRTDIDGLRALAILPVLLYHAKLGCAGGYVGVETNIVVTSSRH
jgi:hypothetical protein